jgi:hypothetical protein
MINYCQPFRVECTACGLLLEPGTDRGVEPVRIQALQQPAHRRLRRRRRVDPQRGSRLRGQISGPFGDATNERAPRRDRAHRHRQQRDQP